MKLSTCLLGLSSLFVAQAMPTPEANLTALAERQAGPVLTDYAYVYFTGERTENTEQVYISVSNNNNPGSWTELKGGNYFLKSNIGERGIRDPTFIVSPDRSKYWIIATDMSIFHIPGGWNSPDSREKGSKHITIWESTDKMRTWSGPRLARVSPDNAVNTWAPEAIWVPERQEYMVYWTSNVRAGGRIPAGWQVIRCFTKDFITFSEAEPYVRLGMDNVIVPHNGRYYMISKNGPAELIQENVADNVNGPWHLVSQEIGRGVMPAGEGPLIFKNNQDPNKWHLWIDNYTRGTGYIAFETNDLSRGIWTPSQGFRLPGIPRHGNVLPITAEERANLVASG